MHTPSPRWLFAALVTAVLATPRASRAQVDAGAARAGSAVATPDAVGAWSAADGGLRARLVVTPASVPARSAFELAIDVEHVGAAPLALVTGDPFAFVLTVRDATGREVRGALTRVDVLHAQRWARLAPGAVQRVVVSIRSVGGAAPSQIDVTTQIWRLRPGRYTLSARRVAGSVASPAPSGAARWSGSLALPAVTIEVR